MVPHSKSFFFIGSGNCWSQIHLIRQLVLQESVYVRQAYSVAMRKSFPQFFGGMSVGTYKNIRLHTEKHLPYG